MSGNLKQWWKNETIDAFRQRAQCMIDQYSSYKLEQIGLNVGSINECSDRKVKIVVKVKWIFLHTNDILQKFYWNENNQD